MIAAAPMFRTALSALGVAVGLLAGASATAEQLLARADATGRLPAGAYQLAYDVELLGTQVVTLGVDIGLSPDSYDVTAQIKTVGLANWILGWKQDIRSKGAVRPGTLLPDQHFSVSEFRGRTRKAEIDYANGRVSNLRLDPPPRNSADDVTTQQRAGTRDPMSAILAMMLAANQGAACDGRMAVFDGRRRYDLVVDKLPAGRVAAPAAGAGLACEVQFVRIAGERRPGGEDNDPPALPRRQEPSDRARVWIAPVDALGAMAPVRIEFESSLGTMNLTLREANFRVGVASNGRGR